MAAVVVALELLVASRYGWHRDELYFREAGRHLAWGYVDQPPFTPLVARLADSIAPGNLVVLRVLPALAAGAVVAVAGLLARELGGDRRAQIASAATVGAGGFLLGVGHLLSTATFDLLAWMALLLVATRLLRTDEPRWWVVFGVVAGASMLNKNLLVVLGVALLTGLVVERRWRLLASPWLVAGAGLALLIAAPNLWWQAGHDWPQLRMARAISERIGTENRVTLVPLQVLLVGPAFLFVWWRGLRALHGAAELRRFRPLVWAWPVGVAAVLVTGGRPYYAVPLTLVLVVAGIAGTPWRPALPWLIAANAIVSVVLSLPVLPESAASVTGTVNETAGETIGWPELVGQVADAVAGLPPDERASAIVLTATYGEAGAVDRFGHRWGLPQAYSPHNSYADFRRPTDDAATVVAVRFDPGYLERWFESCDRVATVDNAAGVDNEVRGAPISVCRGLRGTWAEAWEEMRYLS